MPPPDPIAPAADAACRPLRIAVIAHLRHPIATPFMGGMEAHADLLVRSLRRRGHDAVLFASGDSASDLPLRPIAPCAYESELPWAIWRDSQRLRDWQEAAYRRAWDEIAGGGFDLVHNNALFPDLHDWAQRDRVAMVTSLHVPPFTALAEAVASNDAPHLRLTVTSASQQRLWSAIGGQRPAIAYNGIDLAHWRYVAAGNGRALWCGRLTPNKGALEAIKAARTAGIGLDLIGPIDSPDYFEQVMKAVGNGQRYLGHLSGAALAARVGAAAVMICAPLWDEPFGLVAAEALACGVPVASLDRGALGEVIGDCGALAADPTQFPAAIMQAINVSRQACRARAEAEFGADAMIARYEESYAAALAGMSASSMASTRALLA